MDGKISNFRCLHPHPAVRRQMPPSNAPQALLSVSLIFSLESKHFCIGDIPPLLTSCWTPTRYYVLQRILKAIPVFIGNYALISNGSPKRLHALRASFTLSTFSSPLFSKTTFSCPLTTIVLLDMTRYIFLPRTSMLATYVLFWDKRT